MDPADGGVSVFVPHLGSGQGRGRRRSGRGRLRRRRQQVGNLGQCVGARQRGHGVQRGYQLLAAHSPTRCPCLRRGDRVNEADAQVGNARKRIPCGHRQRRFVRAKQPAIAQERPQGVQVRSVGSRAQAGRRGTGLDPAPCGVSVDQHRGRRRQPLKEARHERARQLEGQQRELVVEKRQALGYQVGRELDGCRRNARGPADPRGLHDDDPPGRQSATQLGRLKGGRPRQARHRDKRRTLAVDPDPELATACGDVVWAGHQAPYSDRDTAAGHSRSVGVDSESTRSCSNSGATTAGSRPRCRATMSGSFSSSAGDPAEMMSPRWIR